MDDDGVLVDGENPLEAGRAGDSSTLGGYPALADREPAKPDDPADGAGAAGASVTVDDDGVLHTESRAPESLAA